MRGGTLIQPIAMEICTFLKVANVISQANIDDCRLRGLVSARDPSLCSSDMKLTWPSQRCIALLQWHTISTDGHNLGKMAVNEYSNRILGTLCKDSCQPTAPFHYISHAMAVAQDTVVRAMSASYQNGINYILRRSQTP
jgi:hypothetical protein